MINLTINDNKMTKNKILRSLTVLFSGTLLLGCASDEAVDEYVWAATDKVYSSASITSSKASIGASGDIIIVWQEQETEVRDDTAKDLAHTFAGTPAAVDSHANLHNHKTLYTKTTVKARSYDSSAASWRATVSLKEGYWEKTKSGMLEFGETNVIYDENINPVFIGDVAASVNKSGNAVVTWVQLGESATVTGDVNAEHNMFVYHYNAATNSWNSASIVTGNVVVQNALDVSLNDSNIAHLVWLGRDDLTLKVNAYQNTYDGTNWSSTAMISDGNGSVKDITLVPRNQTSGVAVWSQYETKAVATDSETCAQANYNPTPLNLVGNWFNATGWYTTPEKISDGTGDVKDFSVASNGNGVVWASWAQTSNTAYTCGASLGSSQYTVTDVSTIKVSQFTNNIDTNLTSGDWNVAISVQPDIAETAFIDESALDSAQPSIAVDADGNVVVAWVEVGDAQVNPAQRKDSIIRANTYTESWLAESFIVSDTARFSSAQLLEKTIPNNHVAPNVVATAANQFTISWQYWSVSIAASGYQIFSVDYNANTNTSSSLKTVSESVSPVVNQMDVFSVSGDVQMLWSLEADNSTSLNKSVK